MSLQTAISLATDLPESWSFRKDLPNGPPAASSHDSNLETGQHRPVRASSRNAAATPEKFYHRACAGGGYPAAQARHDPSLSESAAKFFATTQARPAAPEIPKRGCGNRLAKHARAPLRSGRLALQTAAGRQ